MTAPTIHEMAIVARAWLKEQRVYRYHMKKIADMDDREVLQKYHWWNEENHLIREFNLYEHDRLYSDSGESEDKNHDPADSL